MDMKMLNQILEIAFEKKVSDLHFEVGNPPFFRGRGQLLRSKLAQLTPDETQFIADRIMEHNNRKLAADFKALGDALQKGDISSAKTAFAKLQQDAQSIHKGHHHRHHASGTQDTQSTLLNSTGTTSSNSSTSTAGNIDISV